jgi:hypothetical protein
MNFILCFIEMNFIFKNKKYLFLDNISNTCSLSWYFFSFILFNKFHTCIYLYYCLIKKFNFNKQIK